jgi:hypothetical protein
VSWLYSRALVEEYSQVSGASFAPSNTTEPPPRYYSTDRTPDTSRRSRSGMTCAPLTDDHGAALLTWYREDSLARTSASQEEEPDWTANAPGCGESSPASFARFDPATCSWKTPQLSLLGGSESFSETWPRWGMMRGGECSELSMPEHPTSESGSGLSRPWPTPVATDGTHGGRVTPRKSREGGNLIEAVAARTMWPTPTAQDAANNGGPSQSERNTPPLNAIVGGLLNPDWVEWLMGWPVGWTDTTRDDVETHDWTAEPCPRVTTRRDLRATRLKQCGNGQVPQCARAAFALLCARMLEDADS